MCVFEFVHLAFFNYKLSTVGQEMFANMIFSWISRILTKRRKDCVREYGFNNLFAN